MNTAIHQEHLARAREADLQGAYSVAEIESLAAIAASSDSYQKIDALIQLGSAYMRQAKFELALETMGQALNLAVGISYNRGIVLARTWLGATLRVQGHLAGAIKQLEEARSLATKTGDDASVVKILSSLGAAYAQSDDPSKALTLMKQGAEIAQRLNDQAAHATLMGNIGNVYAELSEYEQALLYYHHAVVEHERLGMTSDVARNLMNMGIVALEINDLDSALEHLNRALEMMESSGAALATAETLVALGSTHMELGDRDSALNSLRRAHEIYVSTGAILIAAHVQRNIGIILRELGDLHGALECFNSVLTTLATSERMSDLADVLQSLGVLYFTEGFEHRDAAVSESNLLRAIEINEQLGRKKPLYECHLNLADLYRAIGDQEKYIKHFTMYHDLEREVQNGNAQRAAIQHQRQRDVERHEREVHELRLEQELVIKDRELAQAQAEIFRLETVEIARQRDLLEQAYERLRSAFRETTMLRIDNKARFLVMSVTVLLFLFSDSVIDPTIFAITSQLHTSLWLTYAVKILAVLLLKPLEDLTATVISRRQRDRIEKDVEQIRAGI